MKRFNSAQLKHFIYRLFPGITTLKIERDCYSKLNTGSIINVQFDGNADTQKLHDFIASHAIEKSVWKPHITVKKVQSLADTEAKA